MITLALDLNLIPMGVMPRLNVSQYDHGQNVECGLYEGTVPYSIPNGTTAVVQGTKADNTGFEYPCTISNNEVMFKIADQMTVFAGDVTCEVVLLNGEDRIGTINFLLRVEPTALKDDVVISDTDLPLLQQIPEALIEAQSAAEDAQEWAEKSQEYAVGALHWKGNVAFANLPTSDLTAGDVYSVTDDFTTDSRFNEGAGIPCEAGTNIIWGTNGKWDLQARNAVYSFNGRKGAVVPASGDYTAAQITHGNSNVGADIEALQDRWKTIANGNMNNITTNGVYNCVNCSNCPLDEDDEPIATNWSMLVMATDANNVYQFVTSFDTGFHAVFSRKKVRGTWNVWTNSNINLVWDSISAIQTNINTINTDLTDIDTLTVQTVSAIAGNIIAYVGLGGNIVRLHLASNMTQSDIPYPSGIIATLPSNLRPKNVSVGSSWSNQGGIQRYLNIKTDGSVVVFNSTTTDTYISFDVTYLI